MGSKLTNNDTLQLTQEQGFPIELNLDRHLKEPYRTGDFEGKIFSFHHKPDIRNYQMPPIRNFLVENRNGKWIYWGLIHVLEVTHDYMNNTTAGKFKIIYMYTPEEMRKAYELLDRNKETQFFQ